MESTKTKLSEDNISYERNGVIAGIQKATKAVEGCYGAAGYNKIVEESVYPFYRVTNDAKIIVDALRFEDPYEEIGRKIIAEAGDRADKDSADGRKTTMILTKAIFEYAKEVDGLPNVIRQSLNDCIPKLMNAIDGQKREITMGGVKSVATISSESEMLGEKIQSIYEEIGRDAIIEVEGSNLPTTFYEVTDGVRLRGAKAFGQYAYTDETKASVINPNILISKDKITSVDQMEVVIKKMIEAGKNSIVIFCEDIDLPVASRLAMAHATGKFKSLIIKAPTLWKDWVYEDFEKMTGALPIDSKEGRTFKNFSVSQLGTCDKLVSNSEETRVIGIKDIRDHVERLERESLKDDQLKIRVAWLKTKAATLKVGANSESELSLVLKKAKDGCAAAYLALKDGVVVGGGVSLFNALQALDTTSIGGRILSKALAVPMFQIISNSGRDINKNPVKVGENCGYDAKKCVEVPDMFEAGIIDPALVIKNAIKNSISIASTNLSTDGIIKLPKTNENPMHLPNM